MGTPKRVPPAVWILHDMANSNVWCKNYLWWFTDRTKAVAHRRMHESNPKYADLIGPFRFRFVTKGERQPKLNREACHMVKLPTTIWITASEPREGGAKNYIYWHETRAIAREHVAHMRKVYREKLEGPLRYEAVKP